MNSYGMTDVTKRLDSITTIRYSDLPSKLRNQIKLNELAIGRNAYYDEEMEFLKTAEIQDIDEHLKTENAKAEPDTYLISTLQLYRYYKNDLGIELTGDYETDRSTAKKALEDKLKELTGIEGIKEVAAFENAINTNAAGLGGSYSVELSEGEKQAFELLKNAPPELFANTNEEREETLQSSMGASIGGTEIWVDDGTCGAARRQRRRPG